MPTNQYQKVQTTASDMEPAIVSSYSSQQLMQPDEDSVTTRSLSGDGHDDNKTLEQQHSRASLSSVTGKQWFTVAVLCFINLINYMDRFTIAGKFIVN